MADGKVVIAIDLDDNGSVKSVKNLKDNLQGVGDSAKNASGKLTGLITSLGVFQLLSKAFQSLKASLDDAISRVDILNRFPKMMEAMGFSTEESADAVDRLSEGIQGLPTRLDAVTSTAQNIAIMTGDLDSATETTLALNNAFLASGSSSEDAKRGLQQYVQMLSRGEVDMQSWRTLQETMGVALNDLAKEFGFAGESAQSDLYDALKDGDIPFSDFNEKLVELSNTTGGFADRALIASEGIETSMTNIRTAIVTGLANTIQTVNDSMEGAGFGSISENLNGIKDSMYTAFGGMNDFLADVLPDTFRMLGELHDIISELIPMFYGLATAITVFKVLTGFSTFIFNIHFNMLLLAESVAKTYGVLMAHPFVLLIAIIAGLVVAIMSLYKTNETFRNFVNSAWESIKNVMSGSIDFIKTKLEELGFSVDSVGSFMTSLKNKTVELYTAFSESEALQRFKDAMIELKDKTIELWTAFKQSQVLEFVMTMFEFAKEKVVAFKDAVIELINNFNLDSLVTVLLLLLPKFITAFVSLKAGLLVGGMMLIKGIAEGMGITVPELMAKVTETITDMILKFSEALPKYIEAGTEVLLGLIEGLVVALPQIVNTVVDIILIFAETITTLLPMIVESGIQVLMAVLGGIIEALPAIIEAGLLIIQALIDTIIVLLPLIIEVGLTILGALVGALIEALPLIIEAGIMLINALIEAFILMLPALSDSAITIINALIDAFILILPQIIEAGIKIILALIDGLIEVLPQLIEAGTRLIKGLITAVISMLPAIMVAGWELIKALVKAVIQLVPLIVKAGFDLIIALIKGLWSLLSKLNSTMNKLIKSGLDEITSFFDRMFESGKDLIKKVADGIWSKASDLWGKVTDLIEGAKGKILEFVEPFRTAGSDIINGLIGGIGDKISAGKDKVVEVGESILGGIKSYFGINSPSREMKSVGVNTMEGLINGMDSMKQRVANVATNVVNQFKKMIDNIKNVVTTGFTLAKNNVTDAMSSIKNAISNSLNSARSTVSNKLNSIKSSFGNVFNSLGSVVSSSFSRVRSAISSGMSGALSKVTGFMGRFRSAGSNIASSIANGISSSIKRVTGSMSTLASKARRFLPFSPAKEGPLKDLHKTDFAWALTTAIHKSESAVHKAMGDMLQMPKMDIGAISGQSGASIRLPNANSLMPRISTPNMNTINNTSRNDSRTITNDNGVKLNIEKIENNTSDDIPELLEEVAWILNRKRRD